jgi:hypothetical protein
LATALFIVALSSLFSSCHLEQLFQPTGTQLHLTVCTKHLQHRLACLITTKSTNPICSPPRNQNVAAQSYLRALLPRSIHDRDMAAGI